MTHTACETYLFIVAFYVVVLFAVAARKKSEKNCDLRQRQNKWAKEGTKRYRRKENNKFVLETIDGTKFRNFIVFGIRL